MSKAVLVYLCERNKILKVPAGSTNEVDLLELEFKREFNITDSMVQITFQRYDEDWEEYIEIDKQTPIKHKEKLKAVVVVCKNNAPYIIVFIIYNYIYRGDQKSSDTHA